MVENNKWMEQPTGTVITITCNIRRNFRNSDKVIATNTMVLLEAIEGFHRDHCWSTINDVLLDIIPAKDNRLIVRCDLECEVIEYYSGKKALKLLKVLKVISITKRKENPNSAKNISIAKHRNKKKQIRNVYELFSLLQQERR